MYIDIKRKGAGVGIDIWERGGRGMLSQWHAWYMEEGGGGFSTGKRNMNVWNEKITILYHKVKKSKSNKGDEMAYTKTTKIATFRIIVETPPLSLLPLLPMSSALQKFSPLLLMISPEEPSVSHG